VIGATFTYWQFTINWIFNLVSNLKLKLIYQ